ncbi:MAG: MarR family transcriptional regulator [Actinomycetales bacterium]|nr:MarR family transcriptional regulator [Actinomycetales bacterium]
MPAAETAPAAAPAVPASACRPGALAGDLRVAVTRAVRRIRQERSSEAITDGQYAVLAALANGGPMTPSALADHEHVQPPHMSRTLNALVTAGLVERAEHPTDGRQVVVSITDAGQLEVRETRRRRNEWLAGRLARLTADERRVLAEATVLLRRLAEE